ncbi:hypothetical protein B0H10DRAFT_2060828, partial [Mycena sp. CBHHK59/15]
MSILRLAPELIDTIIYNIGVLGEARWKASLRSCSLVSRKFLCSSQRLLFYSLRVHNSNAQSLARSLGHSTHIALYVRDLEIDFDFDREDTRAASVALLRLFPKVERASLSVGSWLTESFRETTHMAILDFLSLPSLRSILFIGRANGSLPSSMLVHALLSHTAVGLRYILVKQDSTFTSSGDRPQGKSPLRQLVLELPAAMVLPVQEILLNSAITSIDTLQHLRLSQLSPPPSLSLHIVESVVLRCSESLQHLDIDLHEDNNSIYLPALPNLRFLTLRSSVHKAHVPNIVMYAIATLPACLPGLEGVTIIIRANEHRETNFIAAPKADTALMSLAHLRDAHFILAAKLSYGLYFAGCVQMQLQLASKAGLLSFSERSWHMKHYHFGCFD